jgi:hypothetical protein
VDSRTAKTDLVYESVNFSALPTGASAMTLKQYLVGCASVSNEMECMLLSGCTPHIQERRCPTVKSPPPLAPAHLPDSTRNIFLPKFADHFREIAILVLASKSP